ncbi:MAG: bifunctional UDP-N-acetylglucosamine diphosphorylase/glucosamine-1-phosphate N-acetyltransferase GlmU [Anaerolineales bacterium]|nr:bifunctional UDP-N-acetylglucosamine diphosphorylase/glucosamine-1-phosphate N-acetyltransferase GlmU [Anaerolineales bacterium]
MTLAAVILAAGQGTRLKSSLPKVLHRLGGQPLVRHALAAAQAVTGVPPVLVVGHGAEAVRAELGEAAQYVAQSEQLGTGHAVLQAAPLLRGRCTEVLVTYGDMPLLRVETLRALVQAQHFNPGPLSLLTIDAPQLRDFGRVVRDGFGKVRAIVEAAQATPEEQTITERNAGAYCFNADWLWAHLPRLPLSPKGEYYLTDIVALAAAEGGEIGTVATADEAEVTGINTRAQLAQAEAALRARINARWMAEGVTLIDPATTYIEPAVSLGRDTVIWPNTYLQGETVVGAGCVLGPNTILRDTTLGDECQVECSVLEGAWLGRGVEVGPFAHLRQGARLEDGVHMGNFGEVKNSTLGPGVKMGHFSYIGDATIGADVNIGAGTITCNFDGARKHKTVIGAGVFIGSDTMLVAPVHLGAGARTGAGSVVTKDVPPDSLAVGVPARVIRKLKAQE